MVEFERETRAIYYCKLGASEPQQMPTKGIGAQAGNSKI